MVKILIRDDYSQMGFMQKTIAKMDNCLSLESWFSDEVTDDGHEGSSSESVYPQTLAKH